MQAPKSESGWFGLKRGRALKFKVPTAEEQGSAIPIRGINSDLPVSFAPNGGAVPGDRIVGIADAGRGRDDLSDPVAGAEGIRGRAGALAGRTLGHGRTRPLSASRRGSSVQSVNEPGTLAQIAQVIAENDGNIDNIRMTRRAPDFTETRHRS